MISQATPDQAGWSPSDAIAIVALVVTALAVVLGEWRHRRDQRRRLRHEAAQVLGPVFAVLTDMNPDRLGFNAGPQTMADVNRVVERWEDRGREPLLALTVADDEEVRTLARDLASAMHNVLVCCGHFAVRLAEQEEPKGFALEQARADHKHAEALAEKLADRLRRLK